MIQDGANKEDIVGYLNDIYISNNEKTLDLIANKILQNTPSQGYWILPNALQWKYYYEEIISWAEKSSQHLVISSQSYLPKLIK